nr:protein rolling stone [Ciona intestinalis]|eukprot:XP_002129493.2 protein rolling stone [Ciona intestinalis]
MGNVCEDEFQLKRFGFSDCPPERFYTTQWHKCPWLLFAWKLFAMLYWVAMWVATLVGAANITYWVYLTNWDVLVILMYLVGSFTVTVYGIVTKEQWIQPTDTGVRTVSGVVDPREDKTITTPVLPLRWFHMLIWQLQLVAMGLSFIVTVLYWTLFNPKFSVYDYNSHAINFVIMMLDFIIIAIPTRLLHFVYMALLSAIYCIFTAILHGAGYTSHVYSFLNWATNPGLSAGICIGITFVATPLVQTLFWCVYLLRNYLGDKVNPTTSNMTSQHVIMTPQYRSVEAGKVNPSFQ